MKKQLLILSLLVSSIISAQSNLFEQAYQNHPSIPRGVLETVAWSNTHMTNLDNSTNESCTGMPKPYGIMGVFDENTPYFNQNGQLIADLSNISIQEQKNNVALQIEAYARAFEILYLQNNTINKGTQLYQTFVRLSEIPAENLINDYALNTQIYEYFYFLNSSTEASRLGFTAHNFNLASIFGQENLAILSADKVIIEDNQIKNTTNQTFSPTRMYVKGGDYAGAIWNPTSCNYSTRNQGITAITVHDTEGSYAGSISWFKNCNAQASAHYVLRSSDGQITQMVEEVKKAWHVGSENNYTIGLEHEGYAAQTGWYTEAMYQASANLVKDICQRRNIDKKRVAYFPWSATTRYNQSSIPGTCVKIKGHQHYPNQTHTDPGPNWDWEYYDYLINSITPTTITSTAQPFYDTGGSSGNYGNDERKAWLIAPTNATSVTLDFTSFETEENWDYLYLYDGTTTNSPLIGKYTGTNSPGTVTAQSGKMLVVFKSECATTKSGWAATISINNGTLPVSNVPSTQIDVPDSWKTATFTAHYEDIDYQGGQGIERGVSHYGYYENGKWTANTNRGFLFDDFNSNTINSSWHVQSGNWSIINNQLVQSDESSSYSMITKELAQFISPNYVYHWKGSFSGNGTNRRGGLYVRCNDETAAHGGNAYFIWFRIDGQKIQFYRVNNSDFGSPLIDIPFAFQANTVYDFKFSFDGGKMQIYINDTFIGSYEDPQPMNAGTSIAFASNGTKMTVDDFMVYRSRNEFHDVYVGEGSLSDFKTQSPNPTTPAGRILSFSKNLEHQLSAITEKQYKVDWTPPTNIVVSDGSGTDIDETTSTTLFGNWNVSTDPNSGVTDYLVSIGTTPDDDDVLGWNSNGLVTNLSHLLTNPIYDQIYYINVTVQNGAGLLTKAQSNGQKLVNGNTNVGLTENDLMEIQLFPNPTTDFITLNNLKDGMIIEIYDMDGKIVHNNIAHQEEMNISITHLANGAYSVVIRNQQSLIIKKIIKQ